MSKIQTLPEEKVKEIALGIDAGQIYTNWHLPDQGEMSSVFMPLGLGALDNLSQGELNDVGMVFEYLEKQAPRSINGMPVFFSMHLVNMEDAGKIRGYLEKIGQAKNNL